MNLKNAYWYFTSRLGNRFCNDVIKHANSKKELVAVTGETSSKIKKRTKQKLNNDNVVDFQHYKIWIKEKKK